MSPVGKPTLSRANAPTDRDVVTTYTPILHPPIEEVIVMKPLSTLALLLAFFVAGCRAAAQPAGSSAIEAPTTPVAVAPSTATPAPRMTAAAHCRVPDLEPRGLLAAIRTESHADRDRVVFQFDGPQAPIPYVRYVDRVTMDPSDEPVPLLGGAFVNIAFHGARLDTSPIESDPSQARRYTGPTRLTPRYPVLQELAVSGDFEAVLSFGLGLSDVAGLSVSTAEDLGCVVVDVWRTSPNTLLWPMTSVSQAREVQQATKDGHQPWTLSAQEVATSYTHSVLGWRQASVERLAEHVFQANGGTRLAIITMTQPLREPGTVWAVASVIQSKT